MHTASTSRAGDALKLQGRKESDLYVNESLELLMAKDALRKACICLIVFDCLARQCVFI